MSDTIDHGERDHVFFAPSGSAQWIACPGGWQAHQLMPDTSSPFAEEGTLAHELAEEWLAGVLFGKTGTPEMVDYVGQYVDWCIAAADGADEVHIETRVDFSAYTPLPNQGGTLDHCAIHASPVGGLAILTDLKYGTGVRVFAKDNPQLMIYALGIYEAYDWLYDFKRFDLRICQPRLGHFDVWEVSVADLLAFGEYVKERSALALQPDAPRVAGEKQCRFCKVKDTCPAHLDLLHQLVDDVFDVVEPLTPARALSIPPDPPSLPPVEAMSVEQLARILPYRSTITGWLDAIHKRLLSEALAGREVPGWHLTEGRSRRKWDDVNDAISALEYNGIDATDKVVVSPAEAEARLKQQGFKAKDAKALVASLVVKPPGRPTLVQVKDGRPVIDDNDDGDVFEEVE